jgi:hypothetical protein
LNEDFGFQINRPFYIISDMIFHRVITVGPSKNLVLQTRTGDKGQMWVFDQTTKTIKSLKYSDLSLDVRGGNAYAYNSDAKWY